MQHNLASSSPENQPDPARDPYYLWDGLEPEDTLPFEQVCDGFAQWLQGRLGWIWDQQTALRTPWHLARNKGLQAWCRYEADQRLKVMYRDSYTAAQFHEIFFREAVRDNTAALSDPFWDALIAHKRREGDANFFRYISVLINQNSSPQQSQQRLLCVLYDRFYIPLQYCTSSAISDCWRFYVKRSAPSPALVR
jgi:hypothetical protein